MELIDGLGYVALGVPEVEPSLEFYRRVGQLQVSERSKKTVFLTGGTEHHWLRLDESARPGVTRMGFQVTDRSALDEVANRLDTRGIPWKACRDLAGDRVGDGIRFEDPDGFEIELFHEMVSLPVRSPGFLKMRRMLHAVWRVGSPAESREFYSGVLGLKVSDWIEEQMVFLRAGNRYHHSVGLVRGGRQSGRLDHFCILVEEIDDVVRARNLARREGVKLRQELVRHAASGSVGTYLMDPMNKIAMEFCTWHPQIDDEAHRARILPASAATADVWSCLPREDATVDVSGLVGRGGEDPTEDLDAGVL